MGILDQNSVMIRLLRCTGCNVQQYSSGLPAPYLFRHFMGFEPGTAVRYDHVRQTGFLPWQVLQTDSLSFKPMRFTNRAISPDLSCNQTFCPSPVLLGLCLLQPISGARVGIIERGNTKSGRSEEFCSLTGGCVRYTA